ITLTLGGRHAVDAMWHPIFTAPFDHDLELAVIDANGTRSICCPCRRVLGGWIKSETKRPIEVRPTHWRDWAKTS
ncbi:MAG: hypothetical protein WCF86_09070, partial [Pseudolabrys sp.]